MIAFKSPEFKQRFNGQIVTAVAGFADNPRLFNEADNFFRDGLRFSAEVGIKLFKGRIRTVIGEQFVNPVEFFINCFFYRQSIGSLC